MIQSTTRNLQKSGFNDNSLNPMILPIAKEIILRLICRSF